MRLIFLKSIILLFISSFVFCQSFLNLDFEYKNRTDSLPKKWYIAGSSYKTELDSVIKYHGKYSVRMEKANYKGTTFGCLTGILSSDLLKGKEITLKGYIKVQNIDSGYAGLWLRIDKNNSKSLFLDNMSNRGIRGTKDWQQVSIKTSIPDEATVAYFGPIFPGGGKAWFDYLEIEIDGKKIQDIAPITREPNPDEIDCLKKAIIPLKTVEAIENDEDLLPLKEAFSKAEITALGEVTHGSSDIFKMKHRLVKFLREKCGYNIFSIEANMPESYLINDYVLNGTGDPRILIAGMYFWTWNTMEVLNMVNWMKEYNAKNDKKIQFTGFDMQSFKGPVDELRKAADKYNNDSLKSKILQLDLALNETKDYLFDKRIDGNMRHEKKAKVSDLINEVNSIIAKLEISQKETDWLNQNTRILNQYLGGDDYTNRDRSMAENAIWIYEHNKPSKIAIWAHNGHIQKTGFTMGKDLKEKFGKEYLTVGFAFNKGKYTATGKNKLGTYDAQESYPGTYEYFFRSIDVPVFALDLREIPKDNPAANWLYRTLEFRSTGAVKTDNEFIDFSLTNNFDIIIFINESHNSELLLKDSKKDK
jgi:erythromycin esterase